ncbi:nucleoside triphosphate pyrophosphohydrolase [Halobacteriovorax sp. HLS]|uniref:nucleoside triphosphate pyrophosphohydrolase n=1 Tax=Halobacteriovorax sp. HLS TaxID=2234000 RepID=UPI000FDBE548|nr:nucleoside triphosphate pyrophosphohydrolase [Halobacteriovorax sp. HLS]
MSYPNFEKMVEVITQLRHPTKGCPWDLKQDHKSLLRFLIEESYEYLHAVETEDYKLMEEEIGDVLLQVVLHCVIAQETNKFDIESVSKVLSEKMIRRHPHVFEDSSIAQTEEQVKENWQKIKSSEKSNTQDHHIDASYLSFPALFSSYKIGKKTNQINFDWDKAEDVLAKVEEELEELKVEISAKTVDPKLVKEEMGDFLFSAAQLARHLGVEPEEALRNANRKFLHRFSSMEKLIKNDDKDVLSMTQLEMDEYWKLVKTEEKRK